MNQVRTLVFGPGSALQCASWLATRRLMRVFVVTAPPLLKIAEPLFQALRQAGIEATVWSAVQQEPTITDFESTLAAARSAGALATVGLGGGSAMDLAKLVAVFLDGRQQLEGSFGIGRVRERALPLVCLPTTSGTGSEVSPIAILLDERDELKKGLISEHLVPDAAFVDPQLTVTLPREVTAATGMDALTHCIEAFANRGAHPVTDTWALEGIRLISANLVQACENGEDLGARTALAQASLYGGLCLGPVNTAAVHALSYPLGGEFHVAHGVSNAVLLPHVLEFNLPAAPGRYAQIARALGVDASGDDMETARRGVARLADIVRACGIPSRLSDFSIPESALDRMARAAMTVTRLLDKNLRVVTEQDAREIYRKAY